MPAAAGPRAGGSDYFAQDARLFASWGVDYLKLDGCNLYVQDPHDENLAAYRKAYAAEQAALKSVGRPIVFSESAPAYFEFSPEWYDVLTWVRGYGQLWREGDDMANYDTKNPDTPRFKSVLFNYAYNLPLGRFQKPGNWNDADFIIGGDSGLSLAESRSQMALWAMMSAPLILSSDVGKLSPDAIAILGNRKVIAIDQDPLGRDGDAGAPHSEYGSFAEAAQGQRLCRRRSQSRRRGHANSNPSRRLRLPGSPRLQTGCRKPLDRRTSGIALQSGSRSRIARHRYLAHSSARCLRPAHAYRRHCDHYRQTA